VGVEQGGAGAGGAAGLAVEDEVAHHERFGHLHAQAPGGIQDPFAAGLGCHRIVAGEDQIEALDAQRIEVFQRAQHRGPTVAGEDGHCDIAPLEPGHHLLGAIVGPGAPGGLGFEKVQTRLGGLPSFVVVDAIDELQ
jgi:hypothetical protein